MQTVGHPRRHSGKELECQCRRHKDVGSVPESGRPPQFSILAWRIPWTQEPVRYSPWGHRESAMMRCVHMRMHACTHTHTHTHGDTNRISGFQELKEGRGTNRQNTRDF